MVEGEYHRAFAIMKLNEDYSNPENVTLEKDSAYLHEYIHFIQDLGTCYGIDQSVDRLSRYLDMIIQIQTDNYSGYLKLNDEADFVSSLFVAAAGDSIEDISDTVCHKVNGIEILEDKEYYEEDYIIFLRNDNVYEGDLYDGDDTIGLSPGIYRVISSKAEGGRGAALGDIYLLTPGEDVTLNVDYTSSKATIINDENTK